MLSQRVARKWKNANKYVAVKQYNTVIIIMVTVTVNFVIAFSFTIICNFISGTIFESFRDKL